MLQKQKSGPIKRLKNIIALHSMSGFVYNPNLGVQSCLQVSVKTNYHKTLMTDFIRTSSIIGGRLL